MGGAVEFRGFARGLAGLEFVGDNDGEVDREVLVFVEVGDRVRGGLPCGLPGAGGDGMVSNLSDGIAAMLTTEV